jgi:cyclophilin family peptidyl-prolyl cis-trans isomerase
MIMLIAVPPLAIGKDSSFDSAAQKQPPAQSKPEQAAASSNRIAVIETDLGTIKIELLEDQSPKTVENFRLLAERGYYDGVTFHRVIEGFMIQGGDPGGDGTGGKTATGKPLPNEIDRASALYQSGYKRGVVAMANKGRPETGASQFFIMHRDYPLPANYTIFGRVIEGIEVVDKIASVHTGRMDRPVEPVIMKRVTIQ